MEAITESCNIHSSRNIQFRASHEALCVQYSIQVLFVLNSLQIGHLKQ